MDKTVASIMGRGEFPKHSDGDVLIIVSPAQQYSLHSTTLSAQSDFFRKELTSGHAAPLSAQTRKSGVHIRWRFELQMPDEGQSRQLGWLLRRDLDANARPTDRLPIGSGKNPFQLADKAKEKPDLHRHYDNFLRAYYKLPARLDHSTCAAALEDAVALADLADSLGSIAVLDSALGHARDEDHQPLYRSIIADALAWAHLSMRIQSATIFCESVVHLVGQWAALSDPAKQTMRPELHALCTAKSAALDSQKKAAEMLILGHYPSALQTLRSREQNVGASSRTIRGRGRPTHASAAYGAHIMGWMALGLFRHWVGQSIANDLSRRAPDGGRLFYTAVARGGEAYLDQAAREAFARHFPLSAKARTRFDAGVDDIKRAVARHVEGLLERRCKLDTRRCAVEWLTCADIAYADVPWPVDEELVEPGRRSPVSELAQGRGAAPGHARARVDMQMQGEDHDDDGEIRGSDWDSASASGATEAVVRRTHASLVRNGFAPRGVGARAAGHRLEEEEVLTDEARGEDEAEYMEEEEEEEEEGEDYKGDGMDEDDDDEGA